MCVQGIFLSACIKKAGEHVDGSRAGGPFEATRLYLQEVISEKKKRSPSPNHLQRRCRQSHREEVGLSRDGGTSVAGDKASTTERARTGEELASLETQLSEQVTMDKSTADQTGANSLELLQSCMRSVLRDMAASAAVQPNIVEESRGHMEQLFKQSF